MIIAIIGAGGQVGSEVALLLANVAGVQVRPIVRSRGGSAFLRSAGLSVVHGDVSKLGEGPALLAGADLIANFALPAGDPATARRANAAIIRRSFDDSAPEAVIIYFSTLAVDPRFNAEGRATPTAYGRLKRGGERLTLRLAKQLRRKAYVFRLGHVCGELQRGTQGRRREIVSGTAAIAFPDRASNIVHTAAIADALLAIGEGRAGAPGVYDLLNNPQWTWRTVYEDDARSVGLSAATIPMAPWAPPPRRAWGFGGLISIIAGHAPFREQALQGLALLPRWVNDRARAHYNLASARRDIASLGPNALPAGSAQLFPPVAYTPMKGLAITRDLLDRGAFTLDAEAAAAKMSPLRD